jgi:Ca2+/Na+ antiporter
MKSIEQIDKQHDSFEGIDRILTIVEQSKKEYESLTVEKASRMRVALYFPLLLSIIGVLLSIYGLLTRSETVLTQLFFVVPFFIFLFVEIKNTLVYDKIINKKKESYKATNSQATEVLREIIPVVSQRENWSAIRKFEIRLRLSKLDINPEGILDDKGL